MNQVYQEIEQHVPHLRRYARAIAHNPVAADDLVQESLTRALTKSHLFRPGTNLRAWLFTILHNLHITEMRRQTQIGFPVDPESVMASLAVPPMQDRGLVMKALHQAMQVLPDEQRLVILLAGVEGMTYEEIAALLDLPVGTVKSRISRGRAALRWTIEHGRPAACLRPLAGARRPQGLTPQRLGRSAREHRFKATA